MEPSLIDPHNHAPELASDDVWGDAVGWKAAGENPGPRAPATVLPPKKSKPQSAASTPTDRTRAGLRIETKSAHRPAGEARSGMEVQKIDGRIQRLNPEALSSPKIPLQKLTQELPASNDPPPPRAPQGEDKEWGLPVRKLSLRWTLGIALGIATLMIVALALLPLINEPNTIRTRGDQASLVVEQKEKPVGSTSWNDLLPRQAEAEQLFCSFACALVTDELLPWLRNPQAIAALLPKSPRTALVPQDWIPPAGTTWNVIENDGCTYGLLEGSLPDFSRFSAYVVLSDKQLRIDWKATTGYGSATFDDLERNQGDPAEIRAWIAPATFYTVKFPESQFQCYRVSAPEGGKTIWCYIKRNDALCATLSQLSQTTETNSPPRKVTLRLEPCPAGSLPNQWFIAALLHQDWITP